jgi:hypothetical protein
MNTYWENIMLAWLSGMDVIEECEDWLSDEEEETNEMREELSEQEDFAPLP